MFDDCLSRKYQIKTRQKNAYKFYTVTWRMCLQSKMFLLFAQLGKNANNVQSELSPIVQWMEFENKSLSQLYLHVYKKNYNLLQFLSTVRHGKCLRKF